MALNAKFEGLLTQLRAYKSSPEGRKATAFPRFATTTLPDGSPYPVGEKAKDLRRAYKRGELAEDRIDALEAVPGWTWNQGATRNAASRWNEKLQQLTDHYNTHQTLHNLRKTNSTLSRWLYAQQHADLTDKQHQALSEIPGALKEITPEHLRGVEGMIRGVQAWQKENPGNNLAWIPTTAEVTIDGERITVGRRVQYYRAQFAQGELPTQDVERIETMLPGWMWNEPASTGVDVLVEAATAYLQDNPDVDAARIPYEVSVTLPSGDAYRLGRNMQRYRRMAADPHKHDLSREDMRKLRSLRGWYPAIGSKYRTNLDPFLEAVEAYLDQHEMEDPNKIPYSATIHRTDGSTYRLGRAVSRYRRKLRTNALAPESAQTLIETGLHA